MNKPIFLNITGTSHVNLSEVISFSYEDKCKYVVPKPGKEESKDPKDYDTKEADSVALYYPGNLELVFRVGINITAEDYKRIVATLKSLAFKLNDGVPVIKPVSAKS